MEIDIINKLKEKLLFFIKNEVNLFKNNGINIEEQTIKFKDKKLSYSEILSNIENNTELGSEIISEFFYLVLSNLEKLSNIINLSNKKEIKLDSTGLEPTWVAVNRDGQELICCCNKLFRIYDKIWSTLKEEEIDTYPYESWGNPDDSIIYLPKGSIEKLIGIKLTWENEPINIINL